MGSVHLKEIYLHFAFTMFCICMLLRGIMCVDCFKCVSIAGDNQACEDPFHNNYTRDILESPCLSGRKHRNGLFPATACIKLSGVYEDTGETMIVRGCALDSGTLTIDTEIVRMSHCGGFYFDERYVSGCLQSCSSDACNSAPTVFLSNGLTLLLCTSISIPMLITSLLARQFI